MNQSNKDQFCSICREFGLPAKGYPCPFKHEEEFITLKDGGNATLQEHMQWRIDPEVLRRNVGKVFLDYKNYFERQHETNIEDSVEKLIAAQNQFVQSNSQGTALFAEITKKA